MSSSNSQPQIVVGAKMAQDAFVVVLMCIAGNVRPSLNTMNGICMGRFLLAKKTVGGLVFSSRIPRAGTALRSDRFMSIVSQDWFAFMILVGTSNWWGGLLGESAERWGFSVSLNGAGALVAAGAVLSTNAAGEPSGVVRAFVDETPFVAPLRLLKISFWNVVCALELTRETSKAARNAHRFLAMKRACFANRSRRKGNAAPSLRSSALPTMPNATVDLTRQHSLRQLGQTLTDDQVSFGSSMVISNDCRYLVVGSPHGNDGGAIYLYERDDIDGGIEGYIGRKFGNSWRAWRGKCNPYDNSYNPFLTRKQCHYPGLPINATPDECANAYLYGTDKQCIFPTVARPPPPLIGNRGESLGVHDQHSTITMKSCPCDENGDCLKLSDYEYEMYTVDLCTSIAIRRGDEFPQREVMSVRLAQNSEHTTGSLLETSTSCIDSSCDIRARVESSFLSDYGEDSMAVSVALNLTLQSNDGGERRKLWHTSSVEREVTAVLSLR